MPLEPLTSTQVMALLDITQRQLHYMTTTKQVPNYREAEKKGQTRLFLPDTVRRLQVANALSKVLNVGKSTLLPTAVEQVLNGPAPEPTRLVGLTDTGIHYVNLVGDLELHLNDFALVANMPGLWPEVDAETYGRVMAAAA
jgi:hypothetical protein